MTSRLATLCFLLLGTSVASADPTATVTVAGEPAPKKIESISLHEQATRIATELVNVESNTDPDMLVTMYDMDRWSLSSKAGKLDLGASLATLAGEATLGLGGSPLAALAAFAGAITLDSAARDVEASDANIRAAKKQKRIKHKMR